MNKITPEEMEIENFNKGEKTKIQELFTFKIIECKQNGSRRLGSDLLYKEKEGLISINTISGPVIGEASEVYEYIEMLHKESEAFLYMKKIGAPDEAMFWSGIYLQNKIIDLLNNNLELDVSILKEAPAEILGGVMAWIWSITNNGENKTVPIIDSVEINDKGHLIVDTEQASRFIGGKNEGGPIVNRVQKILNRTVIVL